MNELKILRLLLKKQGIKISEQQATLDAQRIEFSEFKTKVDAEVAGIKGRLDAVEVPTLPDI